MLSTLLVAPTNEATNFAELSEQLSRSSSSHTSYRMISDCVLILRSCQNVPNVVRCLTSKRLNGGRTLFHNYFCNSVTANCLPERSILNSALCKCGVLSHSPNFSHLSEDEDRIWLLSWGCVRRRSLWFLREFFNYDSIAVDACHQIFRLVPSSSLASVLKGVGLIVRKIIGQDDSVSIVGPYVYNFPGDHKWKWTGEQL